MFDKVLIANRGEIACRVIRTCRRLGVQTVAVFSEADRGALHTRLADEAYEIGPAPAKESYLHVARILDVAGRTGAQAVHPGYGFLAENADFARACGKAGVTFVGPTPEAIEAMGLKHAAKGLMERAGVPVVPGYHGDDQSDARLLNEAQRIGFPVLIKAVAGGGGKGMRRVEEASAFLAALNAARREADGAFADARMLVEKYLARPRHIEVQVLADAHGHAVALHERDCSLQRRHQKLVEEAPAPGVSPDLRSRLAEIAVRAAQAVQYRGAGTIEMIADASEALSPERIYFMEMNTRLQVEHPVTEMITGLDLVEWQLRVAAGEVLPFAQHEVPCRGHAIEVRVCAEDPHADYAPRTGPLLHVQWPRESERVRIETGIVSGDVVSPYYDSMISKVVVWGEDRQTALRHMVHCLSQVQLAGIAHNVGLLRAAVSHPAFAAEQVHTGFLSEHREQLLSASLPSLEERVLLATVLELCLREQQTTHELGASPWADTRAFRINAARADVVELDVDDQQVEVHVHFAGEGLTLHFAGHRSSVVHYGLRGGLLELSCEGKQMRVPTVSSGESAFLFLAGHACRVQRLNRGAGAEEDKAALGAVKSPLPGRVLQVFVAPGQHVQKGDPLVSIEAMKMEHTLRASVAGVVSELSVEAQDQVVEGSTLLVLTEPQPPKE